MGRLGYSAEFRCKVLDLLAAGRSVASVAHDLDMSDQTIYNWRRQDRIDRGLQTGLSTADAGELAAAKKRIRELRRQWRADRALRPAMRSPGRPDPSRVVQRQLWRLIATGVTSAEAARVVGVSVPVGFATLAAWHLPRSTTAEN